MPSLTAPPLPSHPSSNLEFTAEKSVVSLETKLHAIQDTKVKIASFFCLESDVRSPQWGKIKIVKQK